jgi:phosphoribosylformylglycinamidine synthase
VLVTVADHELANFLKHLEKPGIPHARLGNVSSGEIVVDGNFWGTIDWWKEEYDTAIENFLAKETAESALSAI